MTLALQGADSPALLAGLLFGVLLAAAVAGGMAAHAIRVPRVVGYLVAGAACHVAFRNLGAESSFLAEAKAPLAAVKSLALGLILFAIGGVFEIRHLRPMWSRYWRISIVEASLTGALVFAGVLAAGLLALDWPATHVTALAALLAIAAMETAPAATLFVLREYEAKGPVTDAILALMGLNNIFVIVAFSTGFVLLGGAGWLGDGGLAGSQAVAGLAAKLPGSLLIGVVAGLLLAVVHARFQPAETVLALLAMMLVLAGAERFLLVKFGLAHDFLLSALCLGAVFTNAAVDPERLNAPARAVGLPFLVGFFALGGFSLQVEDLKKLGLVGVVYIACRATGKIVGCLVGVRWAKAAPDIPSYLGVGMVCQASLAVGLAALVPERWEAHGATFATVLLGAVVVFEIVGAVLTRLVVIHAGEVKAATLLRRTAGSGAGERGGAIGSAIASLARSLGLSRAKRISAGGEGGVLLARHVMRTNIRAIPASSTFDEVLHLVEQSRFNHFPVVDDDGRLIGVIHFSDIGEILYNPDLVDLVTAADLATADTRCVGADMPVTELNEQLRKWNLASAPVVDAGPSRTVLGVVEQRDVLRMLHQQKRIGKHD